MADVDGEVRPRIDAQRRCAAGRADLEQVVDREDVASAGLTPRDPVELA